MDMGPREAVVNEPRRGEEATNMSLDRDELAARATAARAALLSLCEALSALVPVAPASGAPATEPRRTVGAVVRALGIEWIVVRPGNDHRVQRALDAPDASTFGNDAEEDDVFVRWATREECERHGIPYVARPLPGAPLAAPSRPEWVRITGPEDAERVTVGKAYRVQAYRPNGLPDWITNDRWEKWFLSDPGDHAHRTWPMWEPCAAPGETAGPAAAMPGVSPAATPAAWVPKRGDVVTTTEDPTGPIVVTRDGLDPFAATPHFHAVNLADVRHGSPGSGQGLYILSRATYSRPATSSERAAAGLPVDESVSEAAEADRAFDAMVRERDVLSLKHGELFRAGWLARARVAAKEPRSGDCRPASGQSATKPVDREGLARAIREADFATDIIARWPWEGLNAMQREVYFKRADAAIAFMAKGGAS